MKKNTFLVIAGMPCSGKSTLLRHCLESGIPVFGKSNNDIFKSTCIPPIDKENFFSPEERVENRYWLHELDLYWAKKNRIKLESHVIHFDLHWYLMSVLASHLNIKKQDAHALKTINEFCKIESNLIEVFGTFRQFVPDNTQVLLGFLDTTYDNLCDRWIFRVNNAKGKYSNRCEFLHRFIYNQSHEGKEICDSLVTAARKAFDFAEQIQFTPPISVRKVSN
jgi:hypothetical protein